MDKLKAMYTFTQIADSGSLTAAAQAMESSLPAVVRALGALEAELGARLFNRSTRRVSLTEEGRRYLENCRKILQAVADAETGLHAELEEPSGLVTITASLVIGQMLVAPVMTDLVQRYPKVRCNLVLLDRVVNLLEEGIDIGVRVGELEDSALVAQKIGAVRRVVVASPRYLEQRGEPRHPQDLLKANCIRSSNSAAPWWSFQEKGKQFTLAVTGNRAFNQAAPALAACVEGLGIGAFTLYQVAPYLASAQLQILLAAFEPPPRPIHLIYPHARLLPSRTKVFIEMMKQASIALPG